MPHVTRREAVAMLAQAGLGLTLAAAGGAGAQEPRPRAARWKFCLNTSTIRPASLVEKIQAAAKAGFDSLELWSDELTRYEQEGGSLEDLRKRIEDNGLEVASIIALHRWMQTEGEEHKQALEEARRRLDQAARLRCPHIVASPTPNRPGVDILDAARRYRELVDLGQRFEVIPAMEFLGFFQNVFRLGQAVAIAIESGHPLACIVPDTFHMFRGGSGFSGLRHLNGSFLAIFHINDAPAEPPRERQSDAHRVLPGDGVLPLEQVLRDLRDIGYRGQLSLELFNRELWKQDPRRVARVGLEKLREVVARSGA